MNKAWARKFVSDELRETFIFSDLVDNYHCKTKKVQNGKTWYEFDTKIGKALVFSSNHIIINGEKFKSLTQARNGLIKYLT